DRDALSARLRAGDEEERAAAGDGDDGSGEIACEDRSFVVGDAVAIGVDQTPEFTGRGEVTAVAVRGAGGDEERAVRKVDHPHREEEIAGENGNAKGARIDTGVVAQEEGRCLTGVGGLSGAGERDGEDDHYLEKVGADSKRTDAHRECVARIRSA